MERRKELLEMYKQMKPDMGIFVIQSRQSQKCFLEVSQNVKAKINSTTFQLNANTHPNKELQKEWNEYGEANFDIEVLEKLKYSEDESKTDYREELEILKLQWEEKMSHDNVSFYRKKWDVSLISSL